MNNVLGIVSWLLTQPACTDYTVCMAVYLYVTCVKDKDAEKLCKYIPVFPKQTQGHTSVYLNTFIMSHFISSSPSQGKLPELCVSVKSKPGQDLPWPRIKTQSSSLSHSDQVHI